MIAAVNVFAAMFLISGCKDRKVPIDRHYFENEYTGWAVVVYEAPTAADPTSNRFGGIDYRYGDDGVSLLNSNPVVGARKDRFFRSASGDQSDLVEVRGAVEFTGVKRSEVTGRKWNYLCVWVGKNHPDHIPRKSLPQSPRQNLFLPRWASQPAR